MTLLGRTVVRTTGFVGEPGYNIIHWSAGSGPGPSDSGGVEEWHDTLETSLSALADWFNNQQTITISESVDYFDASDGVILGSTVDPGGDRVIDCTSTDFLVPRSTCAVLSERTDRYINGRRLIGRIFLGPIAASILDGSGNIVPGASAVAAGAFAGCISGVGGRLAVWHRPTPGAPTSGDYGDVVSLSVPVTPGTLRSRKT